MKELRVSYATWKLAAPGLKLYYTTQAEGYHVFASGDEYFLYAQVRDAGDITDFETNYRPGASETASEDDAFVSGLIALGYRLTHSQGVPTLEVATWSAFKTTCLAGKQLLIQYVEYPTEYEIYATDSLVWHITLQRPSAEATDFDANYKANANARSNLSVVLVDAAGNVTTSLLGQPAPGSAAMVAFKDDSGNLEAPTVFDLDTGAGKQPTQGVSLRLSASGGSIEAKGQKTMASSIPVVFASDQSDLTVKQGSQGTHAQRWMMGLSDGSGFVSPALDRTSANAPFAIRLSDGAAFYDGVKTGQLPAALVGGRVDANVGAWLGSTAPTVGQKAASSCIPVIIANDQTRLPVATELQLDYDSGGGVQQLSIIGIALPKSGGAVAGGTATDPLRTDPTGTTAQPISSTTIGTPGATAPSQALQIAGLDGASLRVPFVTNTTPGASDYGLVVRLPNATGAGTDVNMSGWFGATTPTVGQKTMAASIPVVLSSNHTPVLTQPAGSDSQVKGFRYGTVTTSAVTNVAVRSTTFNEQTVNAQRSVSSASASDTSAGTGARQIKITYLDQTGAGPYTETVTLNGTSAVNTVATNIAFIEKAEVVSVGSTGSNVGIITVFIGAAGGGGAYCTIAATSNQSYWCHHYVPTGKTCNITGMSGSNNNASNGMVLSMTAKTLGVATAPEIVVSDFIRAGGGNVTTVRPYGTAIQVTGPARLLMYAAPEGTPSIVNRASFDFYDA